MIYKVKPHRGWGNFKSFYLRLAKTANMTHTLPRNEINLNEMRIT